MSAMQVLWFYIGYAGALVLHAVDSGRRQELPEQTQVWYTDRHRNEASTYDIVFKALK